MEALKQKRTPLRSSLTRTISTIKEASEEVELDVDKLATLIEQLDCKGKKLSDIDDLILNQLQSDKCSQDEFDTEFDVIESYNERVINCQVKTKRLIARLERNQDNFVPQNGKQYSPNQRKYRLPEIELKQFGGDLKEWLGFWSQFKKIDSDLNIAKEDKFQYLLQSTIPNSKAREIVEGFPPTAVNYDKAIEHLKSRFGREDTLVEVYVRDLLKLVLNNALNPKKRVDLPKLYDNLSTQLRALEELGVTQEKYAAMLYPLVESCLSEDILKAWERNRSFSAALDGEENCTPNPLTLLLKFLRNEVESEERINLSRTGLGLERDNIRRNVKGSTFETERNLATASELYNGTFTQNRPHSKIDEQCVFCEKHHPSKDCYKAKSMALDEKKLRLIQKGCCFICLKKGHRTFNCRSTLRCPRCKKKHFLVLCPNLPSESDGNFEKLSKDDHGSKDSTLANNGCLSEVLLQTLLVRLRNAGKETVVRALIDTGSQKSYVSTNAINIMGYDSQGQTEIVHKLFGGIESGKRSHQRYEVHLMSMDRNYRCQFEVLDQERICGDVNKIPNGPWIKELRDKGIDLTDIFGHEEAVSNDVDLLIGADVAGKLLTGRIKALKSGPVAVHTYLGWTIMGKIPINQKSRTDSTLLVTSLLIKDADISDLWKLDVLGISDPIQDKNKEELHEDAMHYFEHTVKRNDDDRYEISLPWREDHPPILSNRTLAEKRLISAKRNMNKEGIVEAYQKIFNDWLTEGIIEEVPPEQEDNFGHYLPHRPVIKENSESTKIRPVFDASAHAKGSPSLNDCLTKGPNLIELIPSIINRFRKGPYGVISDIEKAFLQISVNEKERDFLRFLWFDKDNYNKTKIYRHCRVVFGVSSSPFLLGATILHHLNDAPESLQMTAVKLKESFYVDNCIASFDSIEDANKFVIEAKMLLATAKFNLRGWQTNFQNNSLEMPQDENVPLLGLNWNLRRDTISCDMRHLKDIDTSKVTKRCVLSIVHRVFDPIGFTCPVTLIPKLLLQEAWQLRLTWDETMPKPLTEKFVKWVKALHMLSLIEIPRCLNVDSDANPNMSMHVFCDASVNAYATCIFLRKEDGETTFVQLVGARARVAPLKSATIPRLELLACVIGVRLAQNIKNAMKITNCRTFYWTDSTTVLCWIRRNDKWGTFVWNRTQEIHTLSQAEQWHHVPGERNPADVPSRGCTADQLSQLKWWEGPSWLKQSEIYWPNHEESPNEELVNMEKRKTVVSALNTDEPANWYYEKFSSFLKILRMIAWIFRFATNAKKGKISGELNAEEMKSAEIVLFRLIQRDVFQDTKQESLKSLQPIIDSNGLIRVKTRIILREDTEDFRYPIILPNEHPVVQSLIRWKHIELCHAGVSILMTELREKFWILKSRRTIRKVIRQCVKCKRFVAKKVEVIAAPLPADRVGDTAIFQISGVDLAGPLILKGKQRVWIVLYTCAVYRAVHLELVSSLSTEVFLQSFRRFIARRGRPSIIYSDNGTNFKGTDNAFATIDWNAIQKQAAIKRITWKFNPPTAAWWGGWWERLIGMTKAILRKVLGQASLNYEEMVTVLCDCEQVLNSRPLTYISEDIDDTSPLTPSLFLHEVKASEVPDIDVLDHRELSKRAHYLQTIRAQLRKRFRIEYLGQLRQQALNSFRENSIAIGDVVMVGDDRTKRITWPLAKVLEVFPGKDGHERVARVKTQNGILIRPFQRLYPLEVPERERSNIIDRTVIPVTEIRTRSGRKIVAPQKLGYA